MSVNSPKFHPGQDESPFDPPMPMVNHHNLGPLFKYLTWKGMIQKFAAIKGLSCSENFKVAHGYLGNSIISLKKYTHKSWDYETNIKGVHVILHMIIFRGRTDCGD